MSKERLKEADEWLYNMKCLLSVKTDEEDRAYTQKRIDLFNWLIERVKELEESNYKKSYEGTVKALDNMTERLISCERALNYYADDRIYDPQYKLDIMRDTGKLARETLKELKK